MENVQAAAEQKVSPRHTPASRPFPSRSRPWFALANNMVSFAAEHGRSVHDVRAGWGTTGKGFFANSTVRIEKDGTIVEKEGKPLRRDFKGSKCAGVFWNDSHLRGDFTHGQVIATAQYLRAEEEAEKAKKKAKAKQDDADE